MSRIADLVARGVRVTVGEQAEGLPAEVPSDFFDPIEPGSLARSSLSADVQELSAVYDEAQVPPPFRGYGVDRMAEILESRRLASLPREVRVAAVMASLEAAGVSLAQVIRDAVFRERALDGFVAAKEREVEALKQRNEARVSLLREEIEAFVGEKNREIDGLRHGSENASSAFSQLQLRKRQEEERLREVLAHFVSDSENPIPRGTNSSNKTASKTAGS
jgi:hypothetical protein